MPKSVQRTCNLGKDQQGHRKAQGNVLNALNELGGCLYVWKDNYQVWEEDMIHSQWGTKVIWWPRANLLRVYILSEILRSGTGILCYQILAYSMKMQTCRFATSPMLPAFTDQHAPLDCINTTSMQLTKVLHMMVLYSVCRLSSPKSDAGGAEDSIHRASRSTEHLLW